MAAMKNPDEVGAAATRLPAVSGYVCLAWCWLAVGGRWRPKKLAAGGPEDPDFYSRQARDGAAIIFDRLLPRVDAHAAAARAGCSGAHGAVGRALRYRMSYVGRGAAARATRRGPTGGGEDRLGAAGRAFDRAASTARGSRPWPRTWRRCAARGQEVVLVSSGAIALGRRQLGLPEGKLELEESQAAAAVGQIRLAHAWKEVLEPHGRRGRPGAADARRHRAAPALPRTRATRSPRCCGSARFRSSTRTTRSRRPRSATATTTGSRRAWRRWRAPTAWCCCRTSTGSTPRIRRAIRRREIHPGSAADHARDRGHGRRLGIGRRLGRHGHQGAGREDRRRRPAATCASRPAASRTRCGVSRRAQRCTLVPADASPGDRAQAVDRRDVEAGRRRCTSMPAPCKRCAAARACCRPASSRVERPLRRAATP